MNFNQQTHKAVDTQLSIKKMLHSLISLSSNLAEVEMNNNGIHLKFKPSNVAPDEDPVLDQQDTVAKDKEVVSQVD
jgi:hypothetical protein